MKIAGRRKVCRLVCAGKMHFVDQSGVNDITHVDHIATR